MFMFQVWPVWCKLAADCRSCWEVWTKCSLVDWTWQPVCVSLCSFLLSLVSWSNTFAATSITPSNTYQLYTINAWLCTVFVLNKGWCCRSLAVRKVLIITPCFLTCAQNILKWLCLISSELKGVESRLIYASSNILQSETVAMLVSVQQKSNYYWQNTYNTFLIGNILITKLLFLLPVCV